MVFSAMGYFSIFIALNDSLIKSQLLIKLEPRSYEIGEVTIKPSIDYSKFKSDFINLSIPQTELDSVTENLNVLTKKVAIKSDYEGQVKRDLVNFKGDFFHTGVPLRSKKVKQKKAFTKKLKAEELRNQIEKKYNWNLVKEITKLNENEVSGFMLFCNFSDEFLLESNEYEIIKHIYEKFDEYNKIKR